MLLPVPPRTTLTSELDVLSVTTTMEVGVDIGSLRSHRDGQHAAAAVQLPAAGRPRRPRRTGLLLRPHPLPRPQPRRLLLQQPRPDDRRDPPQPFLDTGRVDRPASRRRRAAPRRAFAVPAGPRASRRAVSTVCSAGDRRVGPDRRRAVACMACGRSTEVVDVPTTRCAAAGFVPARDAIRSPRGHIGPRRRRRHSHSQPVARRRTASSGWPRRVCCPCSGSPRVRYLYESVPKLSLDEAVVADRPLGMAVVRRSHPGAVVTKDGRDHHVVDFAAYPQHRRDVAGGSTRSDRHSACSDALSGC